ncbi:MAG: PD-(D/E)XK nuclease family protein [Halothece sp.]
MNEEEIKTLIRQELPNILQDAQLRDFVIQSVNQFYAGKQETESRFDRILAELERDRAENARRWEENQQEIRRLDQRIESTLARLDRDSAENARRWEENNRRWEENNRRWEENNRRWEENQQEIRRLGEQANEMLNDLRKLDRKHDGSISALGARWGLHSEQSFRNALAGILADSFGVEVINLNEYDEQGEVFGRPEQVELDLLIKNGLLIICEIKSSVSKADMYIFEKKVQFYQNKHSRSPNRKLVISPMVHPAAQPVAEKLGIEVYSYAEDVENLN